MSSATSSDDDAITGINVTPLVDVTLVLLIIFLVTAKVIVSQVIPLEIPKVSSPTNTVEQTILSITIDANGDVTIDGKAIRSDEDFDRAATSARLHDKEVRAVIRASPKTSHGAVIHAIDMLRHAEVTRIAFAVQKKDIDTPPP